MGAYAHVLIIDFGVLGFAGLFYEFFDAVLLEQYGVYGHGGNVAEGGTYVGVAFFDDAAVGEDDGHSVVFGVAIGGEAFVYGTFFEVFVFFISAFDGLLQIVV